MRGRSSRSCTCATLPSATVILSRSPVKCWMSGIANLADVAQADDFIVSDKLVSLLLAQVSENKAVNAVFADLFDPEGVEIYLKPAADYVALGVGVNFYTVIEAARRHSEVALGYRLEAWNDDKARAYGVVLSPKKSEIVTFSKDDRIVVLAES